MSGVCVLRMAIVAALLSAGCRSLLDLEGKTYDRVDSSTGPPECPPDGCQLGPSCDGIARQCGEKGDESCCKSILVPGGSFSQQDNPSLRATPTDFILDKFEVTVARYRAFVLAYRGGYRPGAGVGAHPLHPDSGWQEAWNQELPVDADALTAALACDASSATFTGAPPTNDLRPVNCLSWYLSFAFCAWDKGRLPTRAEWRYAAAGGAEQRYYPWSRVSAWTVISADHASYSVDRGCRGDPMMLAQCDVNDYVHVGTKPLGNGRWTHADLAGNVKEWVLDCAGATKETCDDCVVSTGCPSRMLYGGGIHNMSTELVLTSEYQTAPPALVEDDRGVRCARDLSGDKGTRP